MSRSNCNRRKGMEHVNNIIKYWSSSNTYNNGQYIKGQCFACGSVGNGYCLERSHIVPLNEGGDNSASNLHILCKKCHLESEYYIGESYWVWYRYKIENEFDYGLSDTIRKIKIMMLGRGINKTIDELTDTEKEELLESFKRHPYDVSSH